MTDQFRVNDSGVREQFDSGMVRDTEEGKTDFTLVLDGPMFKRWAEHLTLGAVKYSARNWMLATGMAELMRFKASALRHFLQWFWGNTDEDHGSAVFFNINGAEYVKDRMRDNEAAKLIAGREAAIAFEKRMVTIDEWLHEDKVSRPVTPIMGCGGNCGNCSCA